MPPKQDWEKGKSQVNLKNFAILPIKLLIFFNFLAGRPSEESKEVIKGI